MNMKVLLPAAALLLVSLMPARALSRDYDNCNFGNGATQAGALTPFSSTSGGQLDVYGNPVAYSGNGNMCADSDRGFRGGGHHNKIRRAMMRQGMDPRGYQTPGFASSMNNPFANANPYGGPNSNSNSNFNNPFVSPITNGNNPFANSNANGYNPYSNPSFANGYNPYANPNLANGYDPYANLNSANGYNPYGNGFSNSNQNNLFSTATSASNLSKLGSILSGSGLGNLGSYAQNGNVNGGSLSGLRGLLGI